MKNNSLTNMQQKIKFIILITLICFIFLLFFPGKVLASTEVVSAGDGSHDCGPGEKCVDGHSVWVDDPVIPGWDFICTECGPISGEEEEEEECSYKRCKDGKCESRTTTVNCPRDDKCTDDSECNGEEGTVGYCGDTTCDTPDENCGNCPQDCPCPAGQHCENNACSGTITPPP